MRKKFLWHTDTHLNFAWPWSRFMFVRGLKAENPDGIFLTGDISDGDNIKNHLRDIAEGVMCPVYFVLGNHDYWNSTFQRTHDQVRSLCRTHRNLFWLTECNVITLAPGVALIGTEGWYDALVGDPSMLFLTFDWFRIKDLMTLNSTERLKRFRDLALASANRIEKQLEQAFRDHDTVYLMTHVPPWVDATNDPGTLMENFWLPYNVNFQMGKVIEKVMAKRPEKNVIVLAGHTHSERHVRISHNIEARVNNAHYIGKPRDVEHIII